MPAAPYRCELCIDTVERCPSCRERRAAAKLAARERRLASGLCVECSKPVAHDRDGNPLQRCKKHNADNSRRALASRTRAKERES